MITYSSNQYRPCSRAMAIRKRDFWRVGGFDETIRFIGEDCVFYIEAVRKGLKFKSISENLLVHKNHPPRCRKGQEAITLIKESCRNFVRYGRAYSGVQNYIRKTYYMKTMMLRAVVIRFFALIYYVFRNTCAGVLREEARR